MRYHDDNYGEPNDYEARRETKTITQIVTQVGKNVQVVTVHDDGTSTTTFMRKRSKWGARRSTERMRRLASAFDAWDNLIADEAGAS